MAAAEHEGPPDWLRLLSRRDLVDSLDPTTVARGAAYQRRGAVRHLVTLPGGDGVEAVVSGTRPYRTSVKRVDLGERTGLIAECSCALGGRCKHVVALILEAQARLARAGPVRPAVPQWEGALAPVLRAPEARSRGAKPLALLFEVSPGMRARYRASARVGPDRLLMRPAVPGAKAGWIRSGVSWSDLEHAYAGHGYQSAHREALAALLMADRVRSSSYYGASQWLAADGPGPVLWRLLDDAVAAGVVLVTGAKGDLPVRISPEPAAMVLDATRADGSDLVLQPRLTLPGVDGEPVPVGSPAHGVFVATAQGVTLARLDKPLTAELSGLLGSPGAITIPSADTARFLTDYYPGLQQLASVQSSDGSVEFPRIEPPRLVVHVAFEEDHRTRLRWAVRYVVGERSVDVDPRQFAGSGSDAIRLARDEAAERALLSDLDFLDAAPGLWTPGRGTAPAALVVEATLQGWPTVAFVRDVLPVLLGREDIDVTVVGAPLDYVEFEGPPLVSVSTRDIEPGPGRGSGAGREEDWFDLGILVTVADREVPLADLLTALAGGAERLILDDGAWFGLDRPELHALRRIVEEARSLQDRESAGLRINRYQAGLWEELVALGVVAEQSRRWAESVGALLALEELPHPQPPAALAATLRPYQLDGYQWLSFLWDQRLGGILADDMGLGKTLQTLAMVERARAEGTLTAAAPVLVVAPTSVVATWQREAACFTPQLSVAAITRTVAKSGTPLPQAHLVITSYALFRIDEEHYTRRQWSALILDEAQTVKNHQSRTYQVARTLPAPVKLAITGTPMENSLMDLWSLMSIVAPGLLPVPQRFAELYRKPIESGESPDLLATLRRRIRPLMLRRTKEAVAADLPPKIEQVVAVPLNPAHRRIYDTHLQRERQRILGLLDEPNRNRVAILSALTTLRQLSLDVHLVVPDAPVTIRSSKVDALLDQLVEVVAEGHRCLVFSQFTRFLQIVRARLADEGIGHVYLDGRTRDRPRRIAEFTDGDAPVFLISLKAGGSGLTLTEADYVFVLDPWWNPAVEAQAVDRAHRIGQDRTVMVYRLVSEGTIEEKVVALQQSKRDLFARVVDEGGLMGSPVSTDDIRGLLQG